MFRLSATGTSSIRPVAVSIERTWYAPPATSSRCSTTYRTDPSGESASKSNCPGTSMIRPSSSGPTAGGTGAWMTANRLGVGRGRVRVGPGLREDEGRPIGRPAGGHRVEADGRELPVTVDPQLARVRGLLDDQRADDRRAAGGRRREDVPPRRIRRADRQPQEGVAGGRLDDLEVRGARAADAEERVEGIREPRLGGRRRLRRRSDGGRDPAARALGDGALAAGAQAARRASERRSAVRHR